MSGNMEAAGVEEKGVWQQLPPHQPLFCHLPPAPAPAPRPGCFQFSRCLPWPGLVSPSSDLIQIGVPFGVGLKSAYMLEIFKHLHNTLYNVHVCGGFSWDFIGQLLEMLWAQVKT